MPKRLSKLISPRVSNRVSPIEFQYTPDSPPRECQQLRRIYENLGAKVEQERDVKPLFPELRILVVGRSGSGKSTLIRLLLGGEGPVVASDGTAGKQDIAKEWMVDDDPAPLIIHDTNGIDAQGSERLEVIEEFLNEKERVNKPVHLVWYIVSGIDRRFRDDGGLLLLLSRKKMPFVIVVTHSDHKELVSDIVTNETLDRLLEGLEDGAKVKQNIIRVGNRVKVLANEQLEIKEVDMEALKLVSQKTKELIDGPLKTTWISRQVVDVGEKLEASVDIIVHHMTVGCITSPLTLLPPLAEAEVFYTFWKITVDLCRIWAIPRNFRIALRNSLTIPVISEQSFRTVCRGLVSCLGCAGTVTATVVTSGVTSFLIPIWLYGVAKANARAAMSSRGCQATVILGCIMFVKSLCGADGNWDKEKSIEEYTKLCKTFAMSDHHEGLIRVVKKVRHITDLLARSEESHEMLYEALVEGFGKMLTCSVDNNPASPA